MKLTKILKPKSFDDFIGQSHILDKNKPLFKLIKQKTIPHLIFYGPPSSGKTTLSNIIANELNCDFYKFNATNFKVEEIRKVLKNINLFKILIFIDEIHRLSKNQQEVLLPYLENDDIVFIGATTENPSFALTNGFKSRVFIYELKRLNQFEFDIFIDKIEKYLKIKINKSKRNFLAKYSNYDLRMVLNLIDFAYKVDKNLSLNTLSNLANHSYEGINSKELHYDLISAMIKSIRGSDIDASLYYLARLIVAGERAEFIARRLLILASEDISNANPNAINLATNTYIASKYIGYPEIKIILAQCTIYLASSPKSNSSYKAINKAIDEIKNGNILSIPSHLKDKATNYLYPHDFDGYIKQQYLSKDLKFYQSKLIGFEKTLDEWIKKIKKLI